MVMPTAAVQRRCGPQRKRLTAAKFWALWPQRNWQGGLPRRRLPWWQGFRHHQCPRNHQSPHDFLGSTGCPAYLCIPDAAKAGHQFLQGERQVILHPSALGDSALEGLTGLPGSMGIRWYG
mmetsp:Transcript_23846/g.65926  ORF Transcript_23846/g.65926 Transcript_23846/m.65926 type:complete len:121 (+) Transcript_23846:1011-1373(+)